MVDGAESIDRSCGDSLCGLSLADVPIDERKVLRLGKAEREMLREVATTL